MRFAPLAARFKPQLNTCPGAALAEQPRQPFSPASEAAEFVQGFLVRRQRGGKPVVLGLDEVVKALRLVLIEQLRQLVEDNRLTQFGLSHGVAGQGAGLFTGRLFAQVLAFNEVTERLEQGTGFVRAINAFLTADEVAEVLVDPATLFALEVRDVLLRLRVVLPLAEVDACRQADVVQVQALHCHQVELFGHGHRLGFLHQGNDQVLGKALLVVAEEGVSTGGKVRLFHQPGQVLDSDGAECQEVAAAGQVLVEPAAEWMRA